MGLTTDSEELLEELDKDLNVDPGKDPEEESEKGPEGKSEKGPEGGSVKGPEEEPAKSPEENPEEGPEKDPGKDPEEEPDEDLDEEFEEEPDEEIEEEIEEDTDEYFDEEPDEDYEEDPDEEPDEDYEEDLDEDYEEDADEDSDDSDEGGRGLNLFTLFILLIAIGITAIYYTCTVRTVHVSGNSLYTSEEIARYVISDDTQLRHNSVFLAALYMTPFAPGIPFEESVSVALESYDTIRITVKDMELTAFVPYGGKNLYFSENGIVQEISPLTVKGTTFVTGLTIMKAEKDRRIESENTTGLESVLDVLQILSKYEMKADCIVLGKTGNVTFYLGRVKIQLGRNDFDLKISKIAQIYPYLQGRKGTIDMTNYSSSDENIILK